MSTAPTTADGEAGDILKAHGFIQTSNAVGGVSNALGNNAAE